MEFYAAEDRIRGRRPNRPTRLPHLPRSRLRDVVEQQIVEVLREFLVEAGSECPVVRPQSQLVDDLGLASLDLSTIVARLELRLRFDAFESDVAITDVRTVADLTRLAECAGAT